MVLRSVLVEREPLYRQHESVSNSAPAAFGLDQASVAHVGDDAVGRALDRLFDADRAALLTNVVVAAVGAFAGNIGISVPLLSSGSGECTAKQEACRTSPKRQQCAIREPGGPRGDHRAGGFLL